MKKIIVFYFFVCTSFIIFSENMIEAHIYSELVESVSKAEMPKIKDRYLIFTAKANRHAGIAFAHEDYKHIHSFKKLVRGEFKGEKADPVLFYIMQIPDATSQVQYRIVIDGLWSSDPENPNSFFDYMTGMSVSFVDVPFKKEYKTVIENENTVKFTYLGEAHKNVRLAGSFNNWDPFMYELDEVEPGRYELNLSLPKGTWFYAYFNGSTQLPDRTNKNYVYTGDGRRASVITIK